ncbi:HAD-IA family hydrolase [Nonomuraea sp. NPDC050691]|uniref:HAD family hydrolase n=1 Tax=Nonomuraea sp. NPDC050691 TaxID=3155661 RepID=UPI0033D1AC0B
MQRLALFDLDNTIVDRAAGFRLWAQEFCARHELSPREVDWMVEADGDGLTPKETFFARVRERFMLADSVTTLWAAYRERHPALIPACNGALIGLARLRQAGWKVGLITNGFAATQTSTIILSGVVQYVDGWAISGAEGVRKPERRLFEIAAERCGATLAGGGWMIGDSAAADVGGGKTAGLRTVWIDRGRSWPHDMSEPDHVVADAAEAVAVLLAAAAEGVSQQPSRGNTGPIRTVTGSSPRHSHLT